MIREDFQDILQELRSILSQVEGVTNIGESFTLHYVITTDGEESRERALNVANLLVNQAQEKFNVDLNILVVTQKQLEEAQNKAESPTFDIGAN